MFEKANVARITSFPPLLNISQNIEMAMSSILRHNYRVESKFRAFGSIDWLLFALRKVFDQILPVSSSGLCQLLYRY